MESNTFYDIYLEELKNLPQGTPEEVALCEASYTGQYLRPMLPRPESGAAAPVEKKRTRRKKTE